MYDKIFNTQPQYSKYVFPFLTTLAIENEARIQLPYSFALLIAKAIATFGLK